MKILIVVAFIIMVIFLMVALFSMMTDKGKTNRTVNALTWRIGIWVVLFALLMTGVYTGALKPSNSLTPQTDSVDTTDSAAAPQ